MGSGQHSHQVSLPQSTAPRRKKPTPWQIAMNEVWSYTSSLAQPMRDNYCSVPAELLINTFGKLNPMYGGRPKRQVMAMLLSGNSSHRFDGQYFYKNSGLAFTTLPVIGRSRIRARLSLAGLKLLDHWADKHPRFKPFVDAFVTKKARKEIAAACFDFELGMLPASILRQKAMNEATLLKEQEIEKQAQKIAAKRMVWNRKKAGANSTAQQTLIAQQQTLAVHQQYQAMLKQQITSAPPSSTGIGTSLKSFGAAIGIGGSTI